MLTPLFGHSRLCSQFATIRGHLTPVVTFSFTDGKLLIGLRRSDLGSVCLHDRGHFYRCPDRRDHSGLGTPLEEACKALERAAMRNPRRVLW